MKEVKPLGGYWLQGFRLCWMCRLKKIHIRLCVPIGWRGNFHRRVENNVISASAMEAEFVACIEATIQSLWLWNFMTDLQIIIEDIL